MNTVSGISKSPSQFPEPIDEGNLWELRYLELYLCRIAHANHALTPGFHIIARNSTLSWPPYAIWNDRGDCKETAGRSDRVLQIERLYGNKALYDFMTTWEIGNIYR